MQNMVLRIAVLASVLALFMSLSAIDSSAWDFELYNASPYTIHARIYIAPKFLGYNYGRWNIAPGSSAHWKTTATCLSAMDVCFGEQCAKNNWVVFDLPIQCWDAAYRVSIIDAQQTGTGQYRSLSSCSI